MIKVEVFWSGGIDSSFRVTELSRSEIEIQPYYIKSVNWRESTDYELRAIDEITKLLRNDPRTKAKLNNLIIVDTIPKDRDVTNAYRRIYTRLLENAQKKGQSFRPDDRLNHINADEILTSQWQIFGAFAKEHKGIETAFSGRDDKATLKLISRYGKLEERTEAYGKYWAYIPNEDDKDLAPIMGNIHITALEYEQKADKCAKLIADGYKEVLNKAWFCYSPIDNEPCGQCFTCIHAIREGVPLTRFSAAALERNRKREEEFLKNKEEM
jgi:7-cyano-7-deazaguanine synthase